MSKKKQHRKVSPPQPKRTNPIQSISLFDVAILTSGRVDMFRKCIDSVLSEIGDSATQVFVVEQGVPQESLHLYDAIYEKLPKSVHTIRLKDNRGYPSGMNRAIRAGVAPLVLSVSDDITLHPGSVNALLKRMDDPAIGLCGLKLLFSPESAERGRPAGMVQHVGHSVGIDGVIFHIFLGWSSDNPKTCISREVFSVTGAVFMVRRAAFQKAGGFFEGYGKGYFEDVDLCLTLRHLGYKIFVDTDAVADHYVGATFETKKETPPLAANELIFRSRHMNELQWTEWNEW